MTGTTDDEREMEALTLQIHEEARAALARRRQPANPLDGDGASEQAACHCEQCGCGLDAPAEVLPDDHAWVCTDCYDELADVELVWPWSLRRHAKPGDRVEAETDPPTTDLGVENQKLRAEIEQLRARVAELEETLDDYRYPTAWS